MTGRDLLRGVRSLVLRALIPILTQTVGRFPYGAQRVTAHVIAWLLFVALGRYRRLCREHLEIAFPEAEPETRRRLLRGCFLNASLNAVETLALLARGSEAFEHRMTVEGWENVEREIGGRLLLLGCHAGFWEIICIAIERRNLPLAAIGRRPDDPVFADILERLRRVIAVLIIERGSIQGRRLLRRALKGELALGFLLDQDIKVDGTWVPFFGHPAYTSIGAAEMALGHRMRVVPAFTERRPDGHHMVRFLPALELPDDTAEATALMTRTIEEHIRRHPEQWVWWHRRWRRQPGTV